MKSAVFHNQFVKVLLMNQKGSFFCGKSGQLEVAYLFRSLVCNIQSHLRPCSEVYQGVIQKVRT